MCMFCEQKICKYTTNTTHWKKMQTFLVCWKHLHSHNHHKTKPTHPHPKYTTTTKIKTKKKWFSFYKTSEWCDFVTYFSFMISTAVLIILTSEINIKMLVILLPTWTCIKAGNSCRQQNSSTSLIRGVTWTVLVSATEILLPSHTFKLRLLEKKF